MASKPEQAKWEKDGSPQSLDELGYLIVASDTDNPPGHNKYQEARKLDLKKNKDDDSWLSLVQSSTKVEAWNRNTGGITVTKQLKIPYLIHDKAARYWVRDDLLVGYEAPAGSTTDGGDWKPAGNATTSSCQHLADLIVRVANPNDPNGKTIRQSSGWPADLKASLEDHTPKISWLFREVSYWVHRSIVLKYHIPSATPSMGRIVIGYVGGAGH